MKNKLIQENAEKIHQKMDAIAENGDQQKVVKIVLMVATVAVFIGVVMLLVPQSVLNGITDKFAQKEVETIRADKAAVSLQLGNSETWESFGKKVLEDGKKNIHFPGTFAFLRAHCNLELSGNKKLIFERTYLYLKTVPQLKTSPDLLSLETCKVLMKPESDDVVISDEAKGYLENNYRNAKKDLAQARYQIQTILEMRKMNKQIYGEFYDENTGKSRVEHKSIEVKNREDKEEREMKALLDKEARALKLIEEFEGKFVQRIEASHAASMAY